MTTVAIQLAAAANPCASCVIGCCYRHTVNVGGYDAWIIAEGLQLAPAQFVRAVQLEGPHPRGFLLAPGGPSYELALAKRPTGAEHEPCVFLLELPDRTGRCGIYPLRPLVCQTYPAYTRNGLVGRRDDVVCPDDAWRNGALEGLEWYERLASQHVEHDMYELALARWNYRVRYGAQQQAYSIDEYLDYLLTLYAQLEPVRAALAPGEWRNLCAAWERSLDTGASPLQEECAALAPWAATLHAMRAVVGGFFAHELAQHMADELAAWEAEQNHVGPLA